MALSCFSFILCGPDYTNQSQWELFDFSSPLFLSRQSAFFSSLTALHTPFPEWWFMLLYITEALTGRCYGNLWEMYLTHLFTCYLLYVKGEVHVIIFVEGNGTRRAVVVKVVRFLWLALCFPINSQLVRNLKNSGSSILQTNRTVKKTPYLTQWGKHWMCDAGFHLFFHCLNHWKELDTRKCFSYLL